MSAATGDAWTNLKSEFAAAEDAARLAEVMSFAFATASGWSPLATDVPASAKLGESPVPGACGALLLPRLVGDAGLAWLGQEPVALCALAAYFGPGPSELRGIVEEAERRVGRPIIRSSGPEGNAPEQDVPAEGDETGDAAEDGTTPEHGRRRRCRLALD